MLIFYPIRKFKAYLSKVKFGGYIEIKFNIFVEKFYTCYRDGLNGGRDMRSFSGLYFIFRVVLVIVNDLDTSTGHDLVIRFWLSKLRTS